MMCVRNSSLEDILAGMTPATRDGDYSDVVMLDRELATGIVAVHRIHRSQCRRDECGGNRRR